MGHELSEDNRRDRREELKRAQAALKTGGIKETVNAALRVVGRQAALNDAAAYVLAGKLELPDEDSWAAWRDPPL